MGGNNSICKMYVLGSDIKESGSVKNIDINFEITSIQQ